MRAPSVAKDVFERHSHALTTVPEPGSNPQPCMVVVENVSTPRPLSYHWESRNSTGHVHAPDAGMKIFVLNVGRNPCLMLFN